MEQKNNKDSNVIFEIESLLNKMSNQVNFLIRKEMTMNQLDIDLLMENTRKLYDTICSVELEVRSEDLGIEENSDIDSDTDSDTDTDTDSELIDSSTDELIDSSTDRLIDSSTDRLIDSSTDRLIDSSTDELIDSSTDRLIDLSTDRLIDSSTDRLIDSSTDRLIDLSTDRLIDSSTDRLIDSDTDSKEDEEDADMVWDFTKESEELGVEENSDIDSDSDTDSDSELIDSSTDRLIDSDADTDSDTNTELIDPSTDRLIDSVPVPEEKSVPEEEDSGIRTYRIVRESAPTLGDLLEKTEDNSLAARLQRKPVSDLISAIGINDKFLFLNELFSGSMEKYNKSIRSLNSFSTLLGAKTYMSELQIEFQWDCSSDAYKKLADLVERRFLSIHNS